MKPRFVRGMKHTAVLRDGTVRSWRAPEPEEGRPTAVWWDLFYHRVKADIVDTLIALSRPEARYPGGHLTVCRTLGLSPEDPADEAPRSVLNSFGVTAAKIVSEGAQWRLPTSRETGIDSIIVPAGGRGMALTANCLALLCRHDLAPESDANDIGDLVAIPADGSPALSFNGTTAAVGGFDGTADGTVHLVGSGLAWLKSHVQRAREMGEEWPAHLVARRLSLPDRIETLLLDVRAFCWRPDGWIATSGVKRLVCRDSRDIANYIERELNRRGKSPRRPEVRGPVS